MSHRLHRWTCCDKREESQYMRNGCKVRRHVAKVDTAPYAEHEQACKEEYDRRDEELTREIEEKEGQGFDREFIVAAKDQIMAIERDLTAQRAVVAKFKNIKFH
jgi:hypothetical protein